MKICCFDDFRLGLIEDDVVIDISAALSALPPQSWPHPAGDAVIANTSAFYTLHPGDVIMAGTAASFAPIHPGSLMVAEFEGLGRMEVAVRAHG